MSDVRPRRFKSARRVWLYDQALAALRSRSGATVREVQAALHPAPSSYNEVRTVLLYLVTDGHAGRVEDEQGRVLFTAANVPAS